MKKGLMTFEKVLKDRKRSKRIARRKSAKTPYKWVLAPKQTAKPKGPSFFEKITSLFKRKEK